jgi:hypothetical protein
MRRRRLLAAGLTVLIGLPAIVSSDLAEGQEAAPSRGEGLVRSETSLSGFTVSIAYTPTLNANDAAHRGLLSGNGGSAPARVRVAQLHTNAPIRLGDLALGKRDPAGVQYDLWLEPGANEWQLQVTDSAAAPVGRVALTRRPGAASPHFLVALVPRTINTARLVMNWGDYEAATDVTFLEPSRERTAEPSRPNVVTNYSNTTTEEDTRRAKIRMLAQRSQTGLTLANGGHLSVMFQRTFAPDQRSAEARRRVGLPAGGPAYARLTTTPAGSVVMLINAAVPRLKTEIPLRLGDVMLKPGNQVTGFPGSYSLWLKRTQHGWRLVFNNQPDVWGTQHDARFDAGEVELNYSASGDMQTRPFAVSIIPTAPDRGRLLITWGPHQWSTDFVAAGT